MKRTMAALVFALVAPMGAYAAPINLVTNPGFESGLTGWTCTGADLCAASTVGGPPHSGSFSLTGFDNTGFATLSQDLATTIGETYDFSFWSTTNNDAAGNILRYQIGGNPIQLVPRTVNSYLQTLTSFVAAGAITTINFYFETDPGTGTWRIDDVSATAVPEPGSLMLLGLGVAALVRHRRRAAQQG